MRAVSMEGKPGRREECQEGRIAPFCVPYVGILVRSEISPYGLWKKEKD